MEPYQFSQSIPFVPPEILCRIHETGFVGNPTAERSRDSSPSTCRRGWRTSVLRALGRWMGLFGLREK